MIRDRASTGITISFFLALLLYHFFSIAGQLGEANDWRTSVIELYQVAKLMTTALFFLWAVNSDFLVRGVLRNNYIGGSYEGKSEDYTKSTISTSWGRIKHIEEFQISQTLFSASLSGRSFLADGANTRVASYEGELFKWGQGKAVFAIEMTTDTTEYGVLEFTFQNGNANGVYWSTNPSTQIPARFNVSKVKSKCPRVSRANQ